MNIDDSVSSVERKRTDFKQPISVFCEIGWFFSPLTKLLYMELGKNTAFQ